MEFQCLDQASQLGGVVAKRTRSRVGGRSENATRAEACRSSVDNGNRQTARYAPGWRNSQSKGILPTVCAEPAILLTSNCLGADQTRFGINQVQEAVEYPPGERNWQIPGCRKENMGSHCWHAESARGFDAYLLPAMKSFVYDSMAILAMSRMSFAFSRPYQSFLGTIQLRSVTF